VARDGAALEQGTATAEGGSIINVASISGKQGATGDAAYSASKFAVVGLSQALFEEVRELGIKVCCLCPGYVNTTMVSSGRILDRAKMIQPQDIVDCVLWVLTGPSTRCPVEIVLRPQRTPYLKG
jgi:3-oxoacyl-[acyl-carrier protein] reductase